MNLQCSTPHVDCRQKVTGLLPALRTVTGLRRMLRLLGNLDSHGATETFPLENDTTHLNMLTRSGQPRCRRRAIVAPPSRSDKSSQDIHTSNTLGASCIVVYQSTRVSRGRTDHPAQLTRQLLKFLNRRMFELGFREAPPRLARLVSRHHMNMVMRDRLASLYSIVLKHVQARRTQGRNYTLGDALRLAQRHALAVQEEVDRRSHRHSVGRAREDCQPNGNKLLTIRAAGA